MTRADRFVVIALGLCAAISIAGFAVRRAVDRHEWWIDAAAGGEVDAYEGPVGPFVLSAWPVTFKLDPKGTTWTRVS